MEIVVRIVHTIAGEHCFQTVLVKGHESIKHSCLIFAEATYNFAFKKQYEIAFKYLNLIRYGKKLF